MKKEDLSTLKINKLTQAQYDKALQEGRINENELYLTPDNIGANGLPENAEFKNVTINGGNLELYDYNNGINFASSGAKIYDNKANDELVFDVPTGVLILKIGDEEKQIATLDDISSSGGSALDENGNLVFDGYNKGIVFSANGVDYPEIYFNDQDEIRIDCPTSISNLSVDESIFVNGKQVATLDDIGTGGGTLPTNPEFVSISLVYPTSTFQRSYIDSNSIDFYYGDRVTKIFNGGSNFDAICINKLSITDVYDRNGKTLISTPIAYNGYDFNIGNKENHYLKLYGKGDKPTYNGTYLMLMTDYWELRGDLNEELREYMWSGDTSTIDIDLTNSDTILSSFVDSEFEINEEELSGENPHFTFYNANTTDNKIKFSNVENSNINNQLEIKIEGGYAHTLLKSNVELRKFTILHSDYNDDIFHCSVVINHYKLQEYIDNGQTTIVEQNSNKLSFSGKLPKNALFRFDLTKKCWFVDYALNSENE